VRERSLLSSQITNVSVHPRNLVEVKGMLSLRRGYEAFSSGAEVLAVETEEMCDNANEEMHAYHNS